MKKSIRVLLAIVYLLLPTVLWAQNEEYEKVIEEQQRLRNEIDSLAADTLLCAQRLINLQDSITQQEQLIETNDSLCEQLTLSLDKTVINRTQEEVDELQQQYDELQQTLKQLNDERSRQNERLEEMRNELSSNSDVIATIQLSQQQESMRTLLGPYWSLYNEGMQVLSEPYNLQRVRDIRARLLPLVKDKKKTKLNAEQFAKMDDLDINLSCFRGGVQRLLQLMDDINNDTTVKQLRQEANDGNRETCLNAIRPYLFPEEGSKRSETYKSYFAVIPYLSTKLRNYWNELQEDPFTVPTKTEKEIENLIKKYNIQ